jgi:hypothetical protein
MVSSWLRSSVDSDRVARFLTLLMKVVSLAVSGLADRPRVADPFRELTIVLVEIVSPATARPTVIDSAAPAAIALNAKNLMKLVIIVILVTRLMAGWMLGK